MLVMILFLAMFNGNPIAAQEHNEVASNAPAMNYLRIGPDLATGGHFNDGGVEAISTQGVSLVIDLRDKPPEGQEEHLAAAGIRWMNVPVVWKAPRRDDFEAFSRLMSENEGESILVQCQANYRASAMTYLYRVTRQGVPEPEARKDLDAIWTPEGTWRKYIDEVLLAEQPRSGQP
jgi:protein tyrosine phosphatase (PTP) superfamily phosphohydrolase (DUF442 family)